jgi:hypothetical protein
VGGLALIAPEGTTFREGLVWDIDGDGHDDALAIVERGGDAPEVALVFYRGTAGGSGAAVPVALEGELASAGGFLRLSPSSGACVRHESLARVGRRSAAVELGEVCSSGATTREADRVVALVAWADGLRVRVAFPVVDPPGAASLAFDFDGADLDGDGLDDATMRVVLEGGGAPFEPGPEVHALFRWLDRPAGMSREPGEPEASFRSIASAAGQRATRAKDAAAAVALAAAGRSLFGAVCAESGARRVAPGAAAAVACDAGRALEDLGLARVRAFTTLGDSLRAIAALDASGMPPATRTPARQAEGAGWISSLAPVVQATAVRAIGAVPRLGPEASSWGALRFEPSGSLLVRTLAGVVRVDPAHGDEADAAGELAWSTRVTSPDGAFALEGAFSPCRGGALEVSIAAGDAAHAEGGADATIIPVPVEASIGPRCRSGGREPVAAAPIAWGLGGLELLVAGEPVVVTPATARATPLVQLSAAPVKPGSPRSPDGATLVTPTSQGLLVRGVRARLLRAKELDHGYGELRDCAVSDDATRVACVRGGVAFVGIWPAP